MFQCTASKKCTRWKSSMLVPQNLLRATNPENCNSFEEIFLKIFFSKAKITRFEKTSFKITVTEILKLKLQYLKIQITLKTKL